MHAKLDKMTQGRKPISNQMKILKGTDQPCRMRDEVSVNKILKMPPPPKWLSKSAKKLYRTKAQFLITAEILSEVDVEMFVTFCFEYGRYLDTAEKLAEVSHAAILTEKQQQLYNRLTKVNRDSFERAKYLASEFGFTPVSRMKFTIPETETDPLQNLLNQFK